MSSLTSRRKAALKILNESRLQRDLGTFEKVYAGQAKHLLKEDSCLVEVVRLEELFFVKQELVESGRLAQVLFTQYKYCLDMRCLLARILWKQGKLDKAYDLLKDLDWSRETVLFDSMFWKDGSAAECMSGSLLLLITSLFVKAQIEQVHLDDAISALKTLRDCWTLLKQNAQAQSGGSSGSTNAEEKIAFDILIFQCVESLIDIYRIELNEPSMCLQIVREALLSSEYLQTSFHRKMLLKLAQMTSLELSPVLFRPLRGSAGHTVVAAATAAAASSSSKYSSTTSSSTASSSSLSSSSSKKSKKGSKSASDLHSTIAVTAEHTVFQPRTLDEESTLALMVHQRLCQQILHTSQKHETRRWNAKAKAERKRELQSRREYLMTHPTDYVIVDTESATPAAAVTASDGSYPLSPDKTFGPIDEEDERYEEKKESEIFDPAAASDTTPSGGTTTITKSGSEMMLSLEASARAVSFRSSSSRRGLRSGTVDKDMFSALKPAGESPILSSEDSRTITVDAWKSLVLLVIVLSKHRQFSTLNTYLLRSVNESQIDAKRWYVYALSLHGSGRAQECIRCCWQALQKDTIITARVGSLTRNTWYGYNSSRVAAGSLPTTLSLPSSIAAAGGGSSGSGGTTTDSVFVINESDLVHHFRINCCMLAAKSALQLDDVSLALNYSRAAVRLSLDPMFVAKCSLSGSFSLVDQRSTAYLLFSISLTRKAWSVGNFEDKRSLLQLALKSAMRACMLSPRVPKFVHNLGCAHAELGSLESAMSDLKSLLTAINPFHSESWHLLCLVLSARGRWTEAYRAIEQAVKHCDFGIALSLHPTVEDGRAMDHNNNNMSNNLTSASSIPTSPVPSSTIANPSSAFDSSSLLSGLSSSNMSRKLRHFYKQRLLLTKAKILISQKRISTPLEILRDVTRSLFGNIDRSYKLVKLPKSHSRECPVFVAQWSRKIDGSPVLFTRGRDSSGSDSLFYRELTQSRLDLLITLARFYYLNSELKHSTHKYAFSCLEFAVQFFGGNAAMAPLKVQQGNLADQLILAQVYSELGRYSECLLDYSMALTHYQTAIAYDASHTAGLIGQARMELRLNNLTDAKSFVDSALRVDASDSDAWSVLGQIQQRLGHFELASASFLTSIELAKDKPIQSYSTVPRL